MNHADIQSTVNSQQSTVNSQYHPSINWSSIPNDDEIDLRELLISLWNQKLLVLLITIVFTVAGVVYAFLAPEEWSSNAVISTPKKEDMLPLQRISSPLLILGLDGIPNGKYLFDQFIAEFNSYDNQQDYLHQSNSFKQQVKQHNLDEKAQQRLIRDWVKSVSAEPVDKKGEKPGIALHFTAKTATDSIQLLEGYIQYIVSIQKQLLLKQLTEDKVIKLDSLKLKMKLATEDAQINLAKDIENTTLTMNIAKAAGVAKPLENYSNGDRFPITLGVEGLAKKLSILKSMDLIIYQPELTGLQIQIDRLNSIKFDGLDFRPFSYLDTPSEPLSIDKPKRSLIIILSILLGGMLGCGVVLVRHALKQSDNQ